jgi:hypothetical protein
LFDRGGDDVIDVFAPGIGCDRKRSDLRGVTASDFLVEVRQHDVDALLREPRAGRLSDAARAARLRRPCC